MAEQGGALRGPWTARPLTKEERVAEIQRTEREFESALSRSRWATLGGCACCSLLGMLLMSFGVATGEPGLGAILFWSGVLVGDGGIALLLIRHYRLAVDG